MKILVTGGAGFIGSCFIRHVLSKHDDYEVINLDKLTYAGNIENLDDIKNDKIYRYTTEYDEDIDGIFDDFINENL